jgi:hypothetical protein
MDEGHSRDRINGESLRAKAKSEKRGKEKGERTKGKG